MHTSVRGIIEYEGKIILIHRKKQQEDGSIRDYYVVPGGKKEDGESDLDTVKREVLEEVGIIVEPKEIILEYNSKFNDSIQKFYKCEYLKGIIGTGKGPEYTTDEYEGYIKAELIEKDKIGQINLVPKEIQKILKI